MSKTTSKKLKTSIAVILLPIAFAVIYFLVFMQETEYGFTEDNFNKKNYIDEMYRNRELKDIEFSDSSTSRFNKEERADFHGLNYFEPDPCSRIKVMFSVDTSTAVFKMPTNTDRRPNYRIFGYLNFEVYDTICRLTAFQNMDFKDDPEYGGYLFVPFSDKTNGKESYGAGRYIDIPIPEQSAFFLDFNETYNPYCAYSDRWSCPLVPFENYLEVAIRAGEKKYKH